MVTFARPAPLPQQGASVRRPQAGSIKEKAVTRTDATFAAAKHGGLTGAKWGAIGGAAVGGTLGVLTGIASGNILFGLAAGGVGALAGAATLGFKGGLLGAAVGTGSALLS